jgi:chromosome segregation ATPase
MLIDITTHYDILYRIEIPSLSTGRSSQRREFFINKCHDLFAELLTNIRASQGKSNFKKRKIQKIIQGIQNIIELNKQASNQLQIKEDNLKKELLKAENDLIKANRDFERAQARYDELQVNLTGVKVKKNEVERRTRDLNFSIIELNERIAEESDARVNAVLDLIPFFGLIDGIIRGEPQRAIPFYSQIRGIVSAVSQDLENAERRLVIAGREYRTLENKITKITNKINDIQSKQNAEKIKIKMLNDTIDQQNIAITQSARVRTIIGNIDLAVRNISAEYKFLQKDVKRLEKIEMHSLNDGAASDLFDSALAIQDLCTKELGIQFREIEKSPERKGLFFFCCCFSGR